MNRDNCYKDDLKLIGITYYIILQELLDLLTFYSWQQFHERFQVCIQELAKLHLCRYVEVRMCTPT